MILIDSITQCELGIKIWWCEFIEILGGHEVSNYYWIGGGKTRTEFGTDHQILLFLLYILLVMLVINQRNGDVIQRLERGSQSIPVAINDLDSLYSQKKLSIFLGDASGWPSHHFFGLVPWGCCGWGSMEAQFETHQWWVENTHAPNIPQHIIYICMYITLYPTIRTHTHAYIYIYTYIQVCVQPFAAPVSSIMVLSCDFGQLGPSPPISLRAEKTRMTLRELWGA